MLVQNHQGASIDIDRIEGLTAGMFRSKYLEKQLPVVIAGGARDWPALNIWTKDYLTQVAGNFPLTVKSKSDYGESGSKRLNEKSEEIKLKDLLNIIFENECHPDISYARQTNILMHFPKLALDIKRPSYLSSEKQAKDGLLWIGPSGTIAQMHWDPADNLFVQVKGQKKFILSPPAHSHFTYPNKFSLIDALNLFPDHMAIEIKNILSIKDISVEEFTNRLPREIVNLIGGWLARHNNCDVDAEFPDYLKKPSFSFADKYHATLESGDIIFVPNMWRHYVRSTQNSISVNWFFKDPILSKLKYREIEFLLKKTISEHLLLSSPALS